MIGGYIFLYGRKLDSVHILQAVSVELFCFFSAEYALINALDIAKKGDVIILAGKGQETYQIIGKEKFDFDERIEVYKHLKNI